jgi:hypothetical protein
MALPAQAAEINVTHAPAGADLVEWYFEQGWTDGLPVVPPTRARVDAFVEALGGDPLLLECKVPPRYGSLTREVLAINMVMAGCKPEYAPVVRAAMLALTAKAFNLNGVQATTHMAAPLLVVNGPVAREIGMNGDCNAFGSGNRANATIGRALRLVLLNVGGGWPGELDKSTLGHPGKYTYCVAENEMASPWAPYHVEKGLSSEDSAVFLLAAEPPHSVTNHVANDPEGILDSICSAMSTIANNKCGVERALRRRDRAGACPHDRRQRLDPARCAQLPGDACAQSLFGTQLRSALRQDLQSQPAKMVQTRAGRPYPDRAEPRPHPPLCRRRRGRAVFGVYSGLGPHVLPRIAQHRNRIGAEGADLRRRHLLHLNRLERYR